MKLQFSKYLKIKKDRNIGTEGLKGKVSKIREIIMIMADFNEIKTDEQYKNQ